MNREPLIIRASVVAFIQALLTTIVLMQWWELTPEQTAGWMGVIALGGTMVTAVWSVRIVWLDEFRVGGSCSGSVASGDACAQRQPIVVVEEDLGGFHVA